MNKNIVPKLYYYHWRGRTQQGGIAKGKILACSEQELRKTLITEQISPIKIKKRTPSFWVIRQHTITSKDITLFSRQIATMFDAGLPLNETLTLIKTGVKKAQMRQIITQIQTHLEAGASLSQALKNSSALFDRFYCELVAVGEQTGQLEQILERVASYREKSEALRSKVVKIMIYPCIVFAVAILVSIAMLIFVIPTFSNIFASFNAELPWFTLKVIQLSEYLQQHIFYWFVSVSLCVYAFKQLLRKSYKLRLKISKNALHIPLFGNILTKAAIARFSRTLATTFSAGIPLLTGLTTAGNTTKNTYFESVIDEICTQTAGGKALHQAIQETKAFPNTMRQMIMIGEESGALDDILHKIAVLYEMQVDNTIDNMGKIFEPMIIMILGLLIGSLVVAMYLPMFNLMSIM